MMYIGIDRVEDGRVLMRLACCECETELTGDELVCPGCGRLMEQIPSSLCEGCLVERLNESISLYLYEKDLFDDEEESDDGEDDGYEYDEGYTEDY